jgi:hypothetical protein
MLTRKATSVCLSNFWKRITHKLDVSDLGLSSIDLEEEEEEEEVLVC